MSEKFNKEQQLAIDASITNVLVSAGAGSGKTSVLTARIIDQIINKNIPIEKFLIVTFTNNAAKEMKGRIKKALKDKGASNDVLAKVDISHIETYDAFRLYLVNKYGYKIGINNTIKIAEDDVIKVKMHQIIDDILEQEYKENNENIQDIIELYCDKNDSFIHNFIFKGLLEFLDVEKKDEFIKNYEINFLSDKNTSKCIDEYKNFVFKEIKRALKLIDNISDQKIVSKIEQQMASLKEALNDNNLYEIIEDLKDASKKKVRGIEDDCDKDNYSKMIEILKNVKDNYLCFNFDEFINFDIKMNLKYVPYLIILIKKAYEMLNKFKINNSLYTFSDVQFLSNDLVIKHKDVADCLKKEFDIIMIDEFQDTSNLQESFINAFSKDNVFMVGDVKQSIYAFRGSNPTIFQNIYNCIKQKEKKGIVIDMNTNYRSRVEVTDYVNNLFSNLMKPEFGGINYKKEHLITSGNDVLNTNKKEGQEYGFIKLKLKENDELKNNEKEIYAVIYDIKNRIKNHYQVYDYSLGKLRDCTFKDFAILTHNSTCFDNFRKLFSGNQIPLNVIKEEKIANEVYIVLLLQILRIINLVNYEEKNDSNEIEIKTLFVSIVRSFLFEYDDNTIFKIIDKNTYKNDKVFDMILECSNYEKEHTLCELFSYIIDKFNFIYKLGSVSNSMSALAKIDYLYNKIKSMDELNYSLTDLILYLEKIDEFDIKMEVDVKSDSDDAVVLETMHKSKGLQFKICYFVDLKTTTYRQNKSESNGLFISAKYGFWLPFYSFNTKDNGKNFFDIYKNIKERNGGIEESMRVFYVALTRVVELGIFVLNDSLKDNEVSTPYDATTYYDFIKFDNSLDTEMIDVIEEIKNEKIEDNSSSFKILNKELKYIPLKENETASKNQDKIIDKEIEKIAEFGTHMHLLLEIVDFKNPDLSFIKDYNEKKYIMNFLNSDLLKDIDKAKIYKEYEYYDEINKTDGIIDLMLVYEDHIDIIDYKLKNIEDEKYNRQLHIYSNYINIKFNKKVNCYLFSLIKGEYTKI